MKTRGRPGMLVPTYQELQVDRSDTVETSLTCSTQASSASRVGWIEVAPMPRMWQRQSASQSTCCSIAWIMLASTEGLPGPVIMNRFENPADASPREVRGPARHV